MSSLKTTLDIPEFLLTEAMKAAGASTKREAVLCALREFNRRARMRKLVERLGRSETFMSSDELQKLRRAGLPKTSPAEKR